MGVKHFNELFLIFLKIFPQGDYSPLFTHLYPYFFAFTSIIYIIHAYTYAYINEIEKPETYVSDFSLSFLLFVYAWAFSLTVARSAVSITAQLSSAAFTDAP